MPCFQHPLSQHTTPLYIDIYLATTIILAQNNQGYTRSATTQGTNLSISKGPSPNGPCHTAKPVSINTLSQIDQQRFLEHSAYKLPPQTSTAICVDLKVAAMEYNENERRQGDGQSPERNGSDQHTPLRAFCESHCPPQKFIAADIQHKTTANPLHLLDPICYTPHPQPLKAPVQVNKWPA